MVIYCLSILYQLYRVQWYFIKTKSTTNYRNVFWLICQLSIPGYYYTMHKTLINYNIFRSEGIYRLPLFIISIWILILTTFYLYDLLLVLAIVIFLFVIIIIRLNQNQANYIGFRMWTPSAYYCIKPFWRKCTI